MKDGLVHVCFVIDESGSMWGSTSDVIGGFKRLSQNKRRLKTVVVSYHCINSVIK